MYYASFKCKDTNGNSRKAIPGPIAGLIRLIVILLPAAFKDVDSPPILTTSSNAGLANLSFQGALDQPFSTDRYDYTTMEEYRFRSLLVTPVTGDENPSLTVDGVTVRSGLASNPIDLSPGVRTISNATGVDGNQSNNSAIYAGATYVFQ